ncbi:MAG: hypothetical protein EON93_00925 [Burkholderiales bacterium]|nr:MAG: hypothetical protein EON93_00925 [Burkholderiales bacterium]
MTVGELIGKLSNFQLNVRSLLTASVQAIFNTAVNLKQAMPSARPTGFSLAATNMNPALFNLSTFRLSASRLFRPALVSTERI